MSALHGRVVEVAHILGGAGLPAEEQTSARLGALLDEWRERLGQPEAAAGLGAVGQAALRHLLGVLGRWRPQLLLCYEVAGLPGTNNGMEDFIRAIKRRYRRIAGRKNWNRYLLRYGARAAYYEARAEEGGGEVGSAEEWGRVRAGWRAERAEQGKRQGEQVERWRFRHDPGAYLAKLEARWEAVAGTPLLL